MSAALLSTDLVPMSLEQRLRLGARLQALRRDRSLTVAQVAHEALGYARSHAGVSRLERGVLPAIHRQQLESLNRFFQEDLELLLAASRDRHFNPYEEVELKPGAVSRVAQLQGVVRFGGQAQERMKRFDAILSPEALQAWIEGGDGPALETLDKLSKYFDLTRSWLPAGE